MKRIALLISACFGITSVFAQLVGSDPFSDATGSGGSSYTTGNPLINQTNAFYVNNGGTVASWFQVGSGGDATGPSIGSAGLSYSGLVTSGGGSASFGASGDSAIMRLSSSIGSGSLYFSYVLNLTGAGTLTTAPQQLTAFTKITAAQATLPGSRGSEVVVEDNGSGTGFYIGMMRGGQNGNNNAGNQATIVWLGGGTGATATPGTSTLYNYNDSLFIVGNWNFNTGAANDDTADLWVNPDASTFGVSPNGNNKVTGVNTAAASDLTGTITGIMLIKNALSPNGEIDDLRVGQTWADVTPAVPEPSAITFGIASGIAFAVMAFRRRRAN